MGKQINEKVCEGRLQDLSNEVICEMAEYLNNQGIGRLSQVNLKINRYLKHDIDKRKSTLKKRGEFVISLAGLLEGQLNDSYAEITMAVWKLINNVVEISVRNYSLEQLKIIMNSLVINGEAQDCNLVDKNDAHKKSAKEFLETLVESYFISNELRENYRSEKASQSFVCKLKNKVSSANSTCEIYSFDLGDEGKCYVKSSKVLKRTEKYAKHIQEIFDKALSEKLNLSLSSQELIGR